MPQQAVYPAPVGPTPTGPYEYLTVPFQPGMVNGISAMKSHYYFIESNVGLLSAAADRLDLINGTRIYRVLVQYLWRFPADTEGHYVGSFADQTFRFGIDDPSVGFTPVREWAPCGL